MPGMPIDKLRVRLGNQILGEVVFVRPTRLKAWKTFDGLAVVLPTSVQIDLEGDAIAILSGLRAIVRLGGSELGVAEDANLYRTGAREAGELILRLHADTVRAAERARNGGPVTFELDVSGHLIWSRQAVLQATSVYERQISVSYDATTWADMLSTTGLGENVVVEIPLPPSPAAPWDDV